MKPHFWYQSGAWHCGAGKVSWPGGCGFQFYLARGATLLDCIAEYQFGAQLAAARQRGALTLELGREGAQ